jgi:hypothetical protein
MNIYASPVGDERKVLILWETLEINFSQQPSGVTMMAIYLNKSSNLPELMCSINFGNWSFQRIQKIITRLATYVWRFKPFNHLLSVFILINYQAAWIPIYIYNQIKCSNYTLYMQANLNQTRWWTPTKLHESYHVHQNQSQIF